jgi:hypothetical protein
MAHSVRQPLLSPDDDGQSALLPEDQGPRSAGRSEAEPAASATDSRSYLARLTFGWVSPLLHHGSTQPQLHQHDLFELPGNLHPAACGRLLRRRWHEVRRAASGFVCCCLTCSDDRTCGCLR